MNVLNFGLAKRMDRLGFLLVTGEREMSEKWSLQSLGLVEKISMPLLRSMVMKMAFAPASNIYFMLQSGNLVAKRKGL